MSRSKKKPYGSITVSGCKAGVEKFFKQKSNRKLRRLPCDIDLPNGSKAKQTVSQVYSFPKDGKTYYGDDPKYTRK